MVTNLHILTIMLNRQHTDCREGKTDPMSEAFLQMAGVFSQLELAMIRARVKSGMENAKAKARRLGGAPPLRRTYRQYL